MKNRTFLYFILLLLFSCENTEDIVKLNPTEMEVRVLDNNGNIVPNAEVKIFRNNRDWVTLSREVDTQITDENGIAHFTDLLPVNYFYFVSFERNSTLFTNQYNTGFGYIDGSNYELADFLTDNAITRVTVNAVYERLSSSQISEVKISQINLYLTESFDLEQPNKDTLTVSLATIVNYDVFADDINNELINDITLYNQIELIDLMQSDVGATDYFENFIETIISVEEFESSVFVLYNFNEDFSKNFEYEYFSVNETIFPNLIFENSIAPYTLELGQMYFGNDIYTVEVILDYQ